MPTRRRTKLTEPEKAKKRNEKLKKAKSTKPMQRRKKK